MYSKYLSPRNDFAFQKIFGEEKNKSIPIAFLNAVLELEDDNKIIDLEFPKSHQPPRIVSSKQSTVDVLVRDQEGAAYIVEIQIAHITGVKERAEAYIPETSVSDFEMEDKYIELKRSIFLAITDYIVFPDKPDVYKSEYGCLNTRTYEDDLGFTSFTFVELPKFNKKLKDLETIEDRWYYFLKCAEDCENIEELIANNPEIEQAYEVLNRRHWREKEFDAYQRIVMRTAYAYRRISDAEEEGREEGERKGKLAVAKALLKKGMSPDEVSKITTLPPQDIQSLVEERV